MELRIKPEYLNASIGGGHLRLIKLKNLPVNKYKKYWDMGFTEYFYIVEPEIEKEEQQQDDTDS